MLKRPISIEDKFLSKVKKVPDGCWQWQGVPTQSRIGYGRFYFNNQFFYAHRFAYEHFKGPIPEGLFVCHKCDNPMCVNPEHLFVGTIDDNNQDGKGKREGNYIKGSDVNTSKLTVEQVLEIRKKYIPGIYGKHKLAKEYGISKPAVHSIIIRENWKHI